MRYRVTSPIMHLGRVYSKGDAIELDPATAYQLVAAKVVELVPEPAFVQQVAASKPDGQKAVVDKPATAAARKV